jgi:signal transduction histidine kinase
MSTLDTQLASHNRLRMLDERIVAANNVQIRDAEPLERVNSYLMAMVEDSPAIGATAMLVADDEVPLAIADDQIDELELDQESENQLFKGKVAYDEAKIYVPIIYKELVVGYIRLRFNQDEPIKKTHIALFETYGKLISKELELANTVAELGFRNESIERKQRELESVISLKNNILSVTTHDLRNPIAAIQGYAELLEDNIKAGNTVDEDSELFMTNIKKSANAMNELVEQLNEVALLELNQLEVQSVRVDINWLAAEVYDIMRLQAENKNIQLVVERSEKPIYVEVDLPKCKRILFNLIGNAIKYTHERGTVKVWVDSNASICKVHVKDTGIGISKDKVEAIFEPFRKLRNHGTSGEFSSGLGLFICNYMVRLFKGSIQVESELGVGSTFSMLLPITRNEY